MTRGIVSRLSALLSLWLLLCAAHADIRVVDDTGYELVMKQPARRVVSLAPELTESLFAVGAGELIIATVEYSDYPEEALAITRIGAFHQLNVESVVSVRPDLVVASYSGNGGEVIDRLRAVGVKVYASEPRQLDDIAVSLRNLAVLTTGDPAASAAADRFQKRLEELRASYGYSAPVTVLYQVWNDPLMTINDRNLIAEIIRLCGGVNAFGNAPTTMPVINIEAVLKADPHVIVASGMAEERPDWLDRWRRWPSLRAARNGHLYFIPPSLLQRYSVRILDGAERMCEFLEEVRQAEGLMP